jgi:molybdopterin-guanine dinucleotide biosynthesis protein A
VDRQLITGAILAGGRALRMGGVDKGLLEFKGVPLIQHAIWQLRPQVGEVVINANRSLDTYARLGLRIVTDAGACRTEYAGPLAGMLAAMRTARTPWVAVVPCDAPRLPPDLVVRLYSNIGAAPAAAAKTADGLQPVICLLRATLADALEAALCSGMRKAEQWLRAIGTTEVVFEDAAAFANLNTAQDLQTVDTPGDA